MEPTLEIKDGEKYAIRSQTQEEKEKFGDEVPTYRVDLDLSDDDEDRLKKQFFAEFKALKDEREDLGLEDRFSGLSSKKIKLGIALGFVVGFYDGFFGPGTGSFLIFGLIGIFGFDFKKASANSKLMNLTSNFTALVLFLFNGIYFLILSNTISLRARNHQCFISI